MADQAIPIECPVCLRKLGLGTQVPLGTITREGDSFAVKVRIRPLTGSRRKAYREAQRLGERVMANPPVELQEGQRFVMADVSHLTRPFIAGMAKADLTEHRRVLIRCPDRHRVSLEYVDVRRQFLKRPKGLIYAREC